MAAGLQHILRNCPRLQELNVTIPHKHINSLNGLGNATKPLYSLQRLTILHARRSEDSDKSEPLLASLEAPNLRHLELHFLHLASWHLPVFLSPQLRYLHLTYHTDTPPPSLPCVLATLGRMRQLEYLGLDSAIPSATAEKQALSTGDEVIHPVHMPSLKEVMLCGKALDCASLLRHIDVPPDAKLSVIPGQGPAAEWINECVQLWDIGLQHIHRSGKEVIEIRIGADSDGPGPAVSCVQYDKGNSPFNAFSMTLDVTGNAHIQVAVLEKLCDRLAALKLETLRIDTVELKAISHRLWDTVLASHDELQHLILGGEAAFELLSDIARDNDIIPNVSSLTIQDIADWRQEIVLDLCLQLLRKRNVSAPSATDTVRDDLWLQLLRKRNVSVASATDTARDGVSRIQSLTIIDHDRIWGYPQLRRLEEKVTVLFKGR
ncbi:hypothetical protein PUNSTDRAFT_136936 [Punctularia strigosozonata HHB-11173 SS5]|uniref:uncharacterized protein n=1 Tax=Punctularia strigosozonata (strain HHB-11173) TaxID=741275 RepID=UPI0004417526|nr:uncharacterized protein PUNSTDRAFT_136936 [Punctularia strigosozonata HHB-11173 SS5]EIN06145.1 hypothetical protein PUNSTDRAFT_136936 [Punctularia strigosozonata HHB-11173 SS5]